MLSFTVAHASIVALRYKNRDEELLFRARPNLRFRGVDWPLFAIFGGLGTALSWLVVVEQEAPTRWAGLGWLVAGFVMYAVYRRRVVHAPLSETVRAPVVIGPADALEYRNVLVPVVWRRESEAAVDLACRLASERRGSIVALTVLEVPLELPLDAELPGQAERKAHELLDEARAIGDAYGVDVVGRLVRARRAGRAIVEEVERRNSEIVVMGAPRRDEHRRRGRIFGGTVDFVLKNAPCRVMVAAASRAA
jgi:APA family basic amino acid/polyamine antiporter